MRSAGRAPLGSPYGDQRRFTVLARLSDLRGPLSGAVTAVSRDGAVPSASDKPGSAT